MLLIQLMQDIATQGIMPSDLLSDWANWTNWANWTSWQFEPGAHGLWPDLGTLTNHVQAQLQGQQFDTDVFKGARNTFSSFIKTGKLWVFLGGLVVGYLLRALTTYG